MGESCGSDGCWSCIMFKDYLKYPAMDISNENFGSTIGVQWTHTWRLCNIWWCGTGTIIHGGGGKCVDSGWNWIQSHTQPGWRWVCWYCVSIGITYVVLGNSDIWICSWQRHNGKYILCGGSHTQIFRSPHKGNPHGIFPGGFTQRWIMGVLLWLVCACMYL